MKDMASHMQVPHFIECHPFSTKQTRKFIFAGKFSLENKTLWEVFNKQCVIIVVVTVRVTKFKKISIITSRGKNYRSLQNSNWSPDVGHADWTRVLPPLYGYRKIRVYAVQGAKPRSNGATSCIPINQQSPYPLNYNDWRPAFRGECRALIMGRVLELRTRHLWARCKVSQV